MPELLWAQPEATPGPPRVHVQQNHRTAATGHARLQLGPASDVNKPLKDLQSLKIERFCIRMKIYCFSCKSGNFQGSGPMLRSRQTPCSPCPPPPPLPYRFALCPFPSVIPIGLWGRPAPQWSDVSSAPLAPDAPSFLWHILSQLPGVGLSHSPSVKGPPKQRNAPGRRGDRGRLRKPQALDSASVGARRLRSPWLVMGAAVPPLCPSPAPWLGLRPAGLRGPPLPLRRPPHTSGHKAPACGPWTQTHIRPGPWPRPTDTDAPTPTCARAPAPGVGAAAAAGLVQLFRSRIPLISVLMNRRN